MPHASTQAPHNPFMVAIAGPDGTGKDTLARNLRRILGETHVTEICLDAYHSEDRATATMSGHCQIDPLFNDFGRMRADFRALKKGLPIRLQEYDHRTGEFAPIVEVLPTQVVLLQGLYPLHDEVLREAIDLAVFIDVEEELRRSWKLKRDINQRGYTPEKAKTAILQRASFVSRAIMPQREHADIVIRVSPSLDRARLDERPTTCVIFRDSAMKQTIWKTLRAKLGTKPGEAPAALLRSQPTQSSTGKTYDSVWLAGDSERPDTGKSYRWISGEAADIPLRADATLELEEFAAFLVGEAIRIGLMKFPLPKRAEHTDPPYLKDRD